MKLIVDIGNTNILLALHDGSVWKHKFRYETKEDQPELFFEVGLRDLLLEWGIQPGDISAVGVSSVVPEMNTRILNAIRRNARVEPLLLTPQLFHKLPMNVPRPYEIGSDIVANALAALRKYQSDSVIIDFGTALTFTLVTEAHGIEGVTIAPGVHTAYKSLMIHTAQLPLIQFSEPDTVLGTSTESAITGGVFFGYIGIVKEILSRIKSERGEQLQVIATGGLAEVLKPLLPLFNHVDRELTIDGIRYILEDTDS